MGSGPGGSQRVPDRPPRGDPDHERDRARPARGGEADEGTEGRTGAGEADAPTHRYVVELVPDAYADLARLDRRDHKAWQSVLKLLDNLETTPDLGYPLREDSEWAGCWAAHCGRDRYRVVWEMLDPEDDYEGLTDYVIPVVVLCVGPKTDRSGRSIYDQQRPDHGHP